MAQKSRSILGMIAKNFINSITPRQVTGTLVGKDHFGTEYYEVPANPSIGKRNPSRWFEPRSKEDFEQELPAEWEAWLRGRRKDPPLEAEVLKNLDIMMLKKKNALEIANSSTTPKNPMELEKEAKGMSSFPKYDEYESMPGSEKKN